jgi:hypothetical protein
MATVNKNKSQVKPNLAGAVLLEAEGQVSRPVSAEPSHGAVNQSPTSLKDKRIAEKFAVWDRWQTEILFLVRRDMQETLAGRGPFWIKAES